MIASTDELIRALEQVNETQYKEIIELRRVIADLTAQLIKAHDQLEEKGLLWKQEQKSTQI